ncbi:MAG: M23 family metallopeptidase [Granulosicoccaceae bacterium]
MRFLLFLVLVMANVACSERTIQASSGQSALQQPDQPTGQQVTNSAVSGGCTYLTPGNLEPDSGVGVNDARVWAPGIASPFGTVNAVAKSQVYLPGGYQSGSSDQCVTQNFRYPHRDTFCETRGADRDSLNCARRNIHQGIDINAGSRTQCLQLQDAYASITAGGPAIAADIIPIRAVSDGLISYIGRYTVDLRPATGGISRFRYLHMNMRSLRVEFGDEVKQGEIIGYYYNDFAGTSTTFHLHFEVIAFVNGEAQYVSPYMSFVRAEERSKGVVCTERG